MNRVKVESIVCSLGLSVKKTSHPCGTLRERRATRSCALTNVQIILDNLFFVSPLAIVHQQASDDPTILRLSLDAKARVNIGSFDLGMAVF